MSRFAFTAPFTIRVLCLCLRLSPWGGGAPLTTRHIIMQVTLASDWSIPQYMSRDLNTGL